MNILDVAFTCYKYLCDTKFENCQCKKFTTNFHKYRTNNIYERFRLP